MSEVIKMPSNIEVEKDGKINPMLKNFFFYTFKRKKEFKELSKIHGQIKSVGIILTPEKSTLKITFVSEHIESTPFTEEEIKSFLKVLNVKPETIKESKSVFVVIDFITRVIKVQQVKKTGEKFNVTL